MNYGAPKQNKTLNINHQLHDNWAAVHIIVSFGNHLYKTALSCSHIVGCFHRLLLKNLPFCHGQVPGLHIQV